MTDFVSRLREIKNRCNDRRKWIGVGGIERETKQINDDVLALTEPVLEMAEKEDG